VSSSAATAAGRRRASARSSRSKSARQKATRRKTSKPSRPAGSRSRRRAISLSLASLRRWLILAAIVVGALAITYFAWFRHSSFVAVQDVKVDGVSTADRERVTAALTEAAQGMSTLDVDAGRLASAVNGFPTVASVSADPSFPHGLTVHVTERRPVVVASDGQRQAVVAAGGSVLPGVDAGGLDLPAIHVDELPESGRLGGEGLEESRVIASAPAPLRSLIEGAATTDDYGIVVTLRGGIDLRFGSASKPRAKWAAAAAVLADPKVTALEYLGVQVPSRPAIGG
jgi:cell division protein FtsQ